MGNNYNPQDFPPRKTLELYGRVFGTPEGKLVLTDILNDLGFFSMHTAGEADIALSNQAKRLLWKTGRWNARNMAEITEAISQIPGYSAEVIAELNKIEGAN